jgi:hypothetical protein
MRDDALEAWRKEVINQLEMKKQPEAEKHSIWHISTGNKEGGYNIDTRWIQYGSASHQFKKSPGGSAAGSSAFGRATGPLPGACPWIQRVIEPTE